MQTSCTKLAQEATTAVCHSEIVALQRAGNCRNIDAGPLDAAASSDVSTPRDAGDTKPAAACILVAGCCASPVLPPGDLPMCEAITKENGESGCADFLDASA